MNALIDADVHITWQDSNVFLSYLPDAWKGRFTQGYGHSETGFALSQPFFNPLEAGRPEGESDPDALLQWMEKTGTTACVLHNWRAPAVGNFGDTIYPGHLAEAYNRWLCDYWLSRSPSFLGSIVVAPGDPDAAAREIARAVRACPQVVQVSLTPGTLEPYGKPRFRPIFRAAAEHGLAVCLHAGAEGVGVCNPPTSHGWPRNILEYRVTPATNFIAHLTSLITEGVFTDFPDLRLLGLEVGGILPLITYLWRFDKNFKALRSEAPWLTELPSAIVRKHIRLGTHSTAIGDPEVYFKLLESFGADDMLLWASNHGRSDAVSSDSDPHLHREGKWKTAAVAGGNARELYKTFSPS